MKGRGYKSREGGYKWKGGGEVEGAYCELPGKYVMCSSKSCSHTTLHTLLHSKTSHYMSRIFKHQWLTSSVQGGVMAYTLT